MNPILWLELRTRIAEKKIWIVSMLYLLALVAGASIALASEGLTSAPAQIGTTLFGFTVMIQLPLLLLMAYMGSAGSIAQEREQRTILAILNSPLPARRIVWGKLVGAWIFIGWLACLSLPFFALAMVWGGRLALSMAVAIGLTLAAALCISCIALAVSSICRRTVTSYLLTAALLFTWFVVLPIFTVLLSSYREHERLIGAIGYFHNPVFLVSMAAFGASAGDPSFSVGRLLYGVGVWVVLSLLSVTVAVRRVRRFEG